MTLMEGSKVLIFYAWKLSPGLVGCTLEGEARIKLASAWFGFQP